MSENILEIHDPAVEFLSGEQRQRVVEGVSFDIRQGEALALVGESGSGKSVTVRSILRLLPYSAVSHSAGSVHYQGEDLLKFLEQHLRRIRGDRIAMVFQEPMTPLNPLYTIEKQLAKVLALYKDLDGVKASARILELLEPVGIPEPAKRLKAYPHELSGGQRRRVIIVMALACEPQLLTTDESTTAFDVTVQLKILDLFRDPQARPDMSLLLIIYDLNLVRRIAHRVRVMQQGWIVEQASCQELFAASRHPYIRELLDVRLSGASASNPPGETLLAVDDPRVWFPICKGVFRRTVDHVKVIGGVNFELLRGQTLGIVGESDSGKSILGLVILRLLESQGGIRFEGTRLDGLAQHDACPLRREMQVVFQDPYGSLSPCMYVGEIVGEGLRTHRIGSEVEQEQAIIDALVEVGFDPQTRYCYPHEFSGGQRQRIAIARTLVLKPVLILLDEPTSAPDRTVQHQVVESLRQLQGKYNLTCLFISHDLAAVKALSYQLIVVRHGKVVEQGSAEAVFVSPQYPYTQQLLEAAFMVSVSAEN